MANELTTQDPRDAAEAAQRAQPPANIFARTGAMSHVNEGAVAIESDRAVAEAQAAFVIAMRNPRNENLAFEKLTNACQRKSFCESAFYEYTRGGQKVRGPSIRFAEEAARCWGNFIYGMFELSNKDGATEMQAFAHDLEANVRSPQNFTVRHIRDKNSGPGTTLTSERDIYEIGANMGSRRMRARILALLPAWYVDDALEIAEKTLKSAEATLPLPDRIRAMQGAFSKANVTSDMLVTRLGHPLDKCTPQELDELRGVLTAIKDGVATVGDEFGSQGGGATGETGSKLSAAAAKGNAAKPKVETTAANDTKAAEAKPEPVVETAKAEPEPEVETQPEPEQEPAAEAESEDMF